MPAKSAKIVPGRHQVVEVADDVVGVVQRDVGGREAQRQAGQPADAEHRQERQREQHRRVEPDRPAVAATGSASSG